MQRYFLTQEEYDNDIILDNNFHHMKNVLRMKKNDKFIINYNRLTFLCSILEINNDHITYSKDEKLEENNELDNHITLIMGFPKNDKLDLIIQKSVELGVSKIILVYMERSVVKYTQEKTNKKLERYKKIIKEASEQSRRNILPEILEVKSLKDINYQEFDKLFLCYENENKLDLKTKLKDIKNYSNIGFIVGPEGGISNKELDFFHNLEIDQISLGKRILRCETAPLYLLSVLGYELEQY